MLSVLLALLDLSSSDRNLNSFHVSPNTDSTQFLCSVTGQSWTSVTFPELPPRHLLMLFLTVVSIFLSSPLDYNANKILGKVKIKLSLCSRRPVRKLLDTSSYIETTQYTADIFHSGRSVILWTIYRSWFPNSDHKVLWGITHCMTFGCTGRLHRLSPHLKLVIISF
jgi:hypothetical protein